LSLSFRIEVNIWSVRFDHNIYLHNNKLNTIAKEMSVFFLQSTVNKFCWLFDRYCIRSLIRLKLYYEYVSYDNNIHSYKQMPFIIRLKTTVIKIFGQYDWQIKDLFKNIIFIACMPCKKVLLLKLKSCLKISCKVFTSI